MTGGVKQKHSERLLQRKLVRPAVLYKLPDEEVTRKKTGLDKGRDTQADDRKNKKRKNA